MSYVNKKGWTSSVNKMITRQQISDVLTYGYIRTSHAKGKITQRYLEKVITLGKRGDLVSRRKAAGILLNTSKKSKDELVRYVFDTLAKKYQSRHGGYTRLLRVGAGLGNSSDIYILQLV